MRNSKCEEFFKSKGYSQVELPKVPAITVKHPMGMQNSLQFYIAVMRSYPKIFDHFEENMQKYK